MIRFQRGFTLMEMMVAMTILAVGMGAIIKAAAGSASNASVLRNKEVARWVALNKMTELQVLQEWSTSTKKGDVEMLNVRWYWQAKIQKVQDPDLRRVDVQVRLNPQSKSYIYSIAGFIGNPELVSTQFSESSESAQFQSGGTSTAMQGESAGPSEIIQAESGGFSRGFSETSRPQGEGVLELVQAQ